MKKKLKWIALSLVIVFVVVIVAVMLNLNAIVRSAVERGTTSSLALNTELQGANVKLFSGDVSLSDMKIASPAGFDAPEMLSFGNVSVDTSYGKVFGEPTAIDSVNIEKPKLVLEFKGTKSNLKTVADNLAARGTGDRPAPTPADPNAKPVKLIIDNLKVSGAQVVVMSDLAILNGKTYTIDIPPIQLAQIGNADGNRNGEEIGKVVSQIISSLTIEAQKSGKLPPELAAILNADLDALINNIGGAFAAQADALKARAMQQVDEIKGKVDDKVTEGKQKVQEQLNKVSEKIPSDLGGILGGKKDEPKK